LVIGRKTFIATPAANADSLFINLSGLWIDKNAVGKFAIDAKQRVTLILNDNVRRYCWFFVGHFLTR
jgi:hypothetical protein